MIGTSIRFLLLCGQKSLVALIKVAWPAVLLGLTLHLIWRFGSDWGWDGIKAFLEGSGGLWLSAGVAAAAVAYYAFCQEKRFVWSLRLLLMSLTMLGMALAVEKFEVLFEPYL